MGLFGASNAFTPHIERITDACNTDLNWSLVLEYCDRASSNPHDALFAILTRLNNRDPHIQLHAISVLGACINNSGRLFQKEVATRPFETEIMKVLSSKTVHRNVKSFLLKSLKEWSLEIFANDSQLASVVSFYYKLKADGYYTTFSADIAKLEESGSTRSSSGAVGKSLDPNVVSSQQEQDDIAKAIELSMQQKHNQPKYFASTSNNTSSSNTKSRSSLYPSAYSIISSDTSANKSLSTGTQNSASNTLTSSERKVRALYDFEAVEENELTFKQGEIIIVVDDSDQNWWLGSNHRGNGLFPSNFVTSDLTQDVADDVVSSSDSEAHSSTKSVQFSDRVQVHALQLAADTGCAAQSESPVTCVDEHSIHRLMGLLAEADPTSDLPDSVEMLSLEEKCRKMGPLIDQQLERIDRRHAQLAKISSDLVDALSMYHQLMQQVSVQPVTVSTHMRLPTPYNPASVSPFHADIQQYPTVFSSATPQTNPPLLNPFCTNSPDHTST